MATISLLSLDQKLLEAVGDWLQVTVTTPIAGSKLIVSTELNNYDHSQDGIFDNRWVYIEDFTNIGVSRLLGSTTYATSGGAAYVYGANLTVEANGGNKATVRISHSSWDERKDSILTAIDEVYSSLYLPVDDRTLITGNALPNGHFEDDTSGLPTHYKASSLTSQTATTAAGLYRGQRGSQSVKLLASASNGYLYITSDVWPQLLDLRGKTVSFKCWMYPQTAGDVNLVIWTIKNDGTTTQELASTTTTYADRWTLVELEDQTINDDIEEIQFRFKITTSGQYCYIDDARVTGVNIHDYRLPDNLANGSISRVEMQTSGNSDDMCDDISLSVPYTKVYGWEVFSDGTYKYLRIPYNISSLRRLRLVGYSPLETLSSASDTITLDSEKVGVIIQKAAYLLYKKLGGPVGGDDIEKYRDDMAMFDYEHQRLLIKHRMTKPTLTLDVTPL